VAHNIALARFAAGGYTDAEGLLSELLSVKASGLRPVATAVDATRCVRDRVRDAATGRAGLLQQPRLRAVSARARLVTPAAP
jgi:hypothetical protein